MFKCPKNPGCKKSKRMRNAALGIEISSGKRQEWGKRGKGTGRCRNVGDVLALRLGGKFTKDWFIIKLYKGQMFFHRSVKFT